MLFITCSKSETCVITLFFDVYADEEREKKALHDAEIAGNSNWNMKEWTWDPKAMLAQQVAPSNRNLDGTDRVTRGVKLSWQSSKTSIEAQPSSSSKGKFVLCQAAGCTADMSSFSNYLRRNKICQEHLRAPSYIHRTDDTTMRFCHRCGYGHLLAEFDGDKHSCRVKLELHNARRRQKRGTSKRKGKELSDGAVDVKNGRHTAKRKAADTGMFDNDSAPFTLKSIPLVAQAPLLPRSEQYQSSYSKEQQEIQDNRPLEDFFIDRDDALLDELSSWFTGHLSASSHGAEETHQQPDGDDGDLFDTIGLFDVLKNSESSFDSLEDNSNRADMKAFDLAYQLMETAHQDDNKLASLEAADAIETSSYSSMMTSANTDHGSTLPVRPLLPLQNPQLMSFEAQIASVSLKLFGCTPAELPLNLREQVISFLGGGRVASVETYLRPGCVHLTVQTVLDTSEHADTNENADASNVHLTDGQDTVVNHDRTMEQSLPLTLQAFVLRMLLIQQEKERKDNGGQQNVWLSKNILVQINNDVALVCKGMIIKEWNLDAAKHAEHGRRAIPVITSLTPAVVFVDTSRGTTGEKRHLEFEVQGMNILQNNCEIVARFHGCYIPVETARCSDCKCSASIKSCCRRGPAAANNDVSDDNTGNWEDVCCGCCIAKIADNPLPQTAPNGKHTTTSVAALPSPCCSSLASHQQPQAKPISLQRIKLAIDASEVSKPGLLHIDVFKGPYTALRSAQVLVVDDESIAKELMSSGPLQRDSALLQRWISAIGILFDHVGDKEKLKFSFLERAVVSLLHEAICAGFMCLAQRLYALLQSEIMLHAEKKGVFPQKHLDIAGLLTLDHACKAATFKRVTFEASSNRRCFGLSLLHCAVISQSITLVRLILQWADDVQTPWQVDLKGPMDLTPLHLAVLAQDPATSAEIILTLISYYRRHSNNHDKNKGDGESGNNAQESIWRDVHDACGLSPADYASKSGRMGLLDVFGGPSPRPCKAAAAPTVEEKHDGPAAKTPAARIVEQPGTPRRCKCTGSCPCSTAAEPCASCVSFSDDEMACCGSVDGRCACCVGNRSMNREDNAGGGCCVTKNKVGMDGAFVHVE